MAIIPLDENRRPLYGYDATEGGLYVLNVRYNSVSGAWEEVELLDTLYWKDQRFDYTSGDLDYKGLSTTHKAALDAGDLWYVWKYTWVGVNCTRIEGPIICNWDDRDTEAWA